MTIYFYKIREQHGIFSNFHPTPVTIDGQTYKTSEAAYQAQKFIHLPSVMKQIQSAATPKEAANMGRDPSNILRADWEQTINPGLISVYPGVTIGFDTIEKVKDLVMLKVLCHKAYGSQEFQNVLLSTGDEEIVEQSKADHYWGCGDDNTGVNRLGKVLMVIRSELRKDFELNFDRNLNMVTVSRKNVNKIVAGLHLFAGSKSHIEFYENDFGCKIVFADGFGPKEFAEVQSQLPIAVNCLLWGFMSKV